MIHLVSQISQWHFHLLRPWWYYNRRLFLIFTLIFWFFRFELWFGHYFKFSFVKITCWVLFILLYLALSFSWKCIISNNFKRWIRRIRILSIESFAIWNDFSVSVRKTWSEIRYCWVNQILNWNFWLFFLGSSRRESDVSIVWRMH